MPDRSQTREYRSDEGRRTQHAKRAHRSVGGRIVRIVVIVVIVVVVACVGGFSLYRWVYGDDAADVQGAWYVAGTDTPIIITDGDIELNSTVAYAYTLDSESKTIAFNLGSMQGEGHYRFSFNRSQLAIMDGTYGWWSSFFSDFGWTARALAGAIGGDVVTPAPGGDDVDGSGDGEGDDDQDVLGSGVTLLSRTPATTAGYDALDALAASYAAGGSDESADSDDGAGDAAGAGSGTGSGSGSGSGTDDGAGGDEGTYDATVYYDDDDGYGDSGYGYGGTGYGDSGADAGYDAGGAADYGSGYGGYDDSDEPT